jgi:6-phosphogluconolactonase
MCIRSIVRFCVPLLIAWQFIFAGSAPTLAQRMKELGVESFIYVGTHNTSEAVPKIAEHAGRKTTAKGLYLFKMRTSDDPNIPEFVTVTPLGLLDEVENPSYLELDAKRRLLYCTSDTIDAAGKTDGSVCSYSIDASSGKLTKLSRASSAGAGPSHLAVDASGKYLLVANSRSGNVAILPIDANGELGEATDITQHADSSADSNRRKLPRPSGVAFSPDNQFAFVCDAGLDRIFVYRFDANTGKLTPHDPAFIGTKAGAGPRRLLFHQKGKFAYVAHELDSTVSAFSYDAATGVLKELQTLSTLPGYYDGSNTVAEIGLHPSGKNLLVSNCGHNSIVLFNIDTTEGTLTYVEDQSTYGKTPRHFGIDATGKHTVVANYDSDNILILRSPENARVKPAGNVIETPSPTCAKFLPKQQ